MEEDSDHETSQIIVDTTGNTVYENRLRVRGRERGIYQCSISNNIRDYLNYISDNTQMASINVQGELVSHPSLSYCNIPPTVAGKPTNLSLAAVQQSNTSIEVSWESPGSPATGYVIYYQPKGGEVSSLDISGRSNTRKLLEGLESGVTYSISIVAVSDHLPSAVVGPVTASMLISGS